MKKEVLNRLMLKVLSSWLSTVLRNDCFFWVLDRVLILLFVKIISFWDEFYWAYLLLSGIRCLLEFAWVLLFFCVLLLWNRIIEVVSLIFPTPIIRYCDVFFLHLDSVCRSLQDGCYNFLLVFLSFLRVLFHFSPLFRLLI